jgi:hypothetical protein
VTPDPLDALRDALALLRAVHDRDADGLEAVAGNLACATATAVYLAEMLDAAMTAGGDRIKVLDEWQRRSGL